LVHKLIRPAVDKPRASVHAGHHCVVGVRVAREWVENVMGIFFRALEANHVFSRCFAAQFVRPLAAVDTIVPKKAFRFAPSSLRYAPNALRVRRGAPAAAVFGEKAKLPGAAGGAYRGGGFLLLRARDVPVIGTELEDGPMFLVE